jgi:hypothetical protein
MEMPKKSPNPQTFPSLEQHMDETVQFLARRHGQDRIKCGPLHRACSHFNLESSVGLSKSHASCGLTCKGSRKPAVWSFLLQRARTLLRDPMHGHRRREYKTLMRPDTLC